MSISVSGYSRLSIALHWLAAIAVVALFFTHEGERGSASQLFHVGGGALLGLLLVWRVVRRPARGFAAKPDQHALLNLASAIVLWGLLAAILVVTITGYMLPWSLGRPLDLFGIISIPSFMEGSRDLHELMEEIHDLAGHIIVPLVLLHVLGALKHLVVDRDGIMQRMLKPTPNGR